ncbi:hypothetical protein RF11_14718 [Thelohanellus kitauei]|uniref:Uncharacterized protein n=1 Tax=Thelohanellus kitauei TaxID=669202 RepID=A0A0C2JAW6_THEKT|nr:hypothetical protein RF11_14718 [Thelohanellus kitauei]
MFEDTNRDLKVISNTFDLDFMFIITKNVHSNDIANEKPGMFISNDGGRNIKRHQIMNRGNPVYITEIISLKRYMFCLSEINLTFVYMDKYLNEIHMQTFEEHDQISPHLTHEEYMSKLSLQTNTKVRILLLNIKKFKMLHSVQSF